jgi:serine/threonine protein kinase
MILNYPEEGYKWIIGTGAFTDVYKGEVRPETVGATPTFVAVKLFRATPGEDQAATDATGRRLIRESNVWLRLKHPNIQPYLGHCRGLGPTLALVSPFCERGCILKFLKKNLIENKSPLIKDVASGLEYLHSADVIHGDLHCKNILVDDKGHALLADFGRSKVLGESGYSTAFLAGYAPYMAPELFPSGDVEVDTLFSKKSDVYAFAMVCFEIFTGQLPFASYKMGNLDWRVVPLISKGRRPQRTPKVQTFISSDMWNILEDCWKQDPERRISSGEIVQRINEL